MAISQLDLVVDIGNTRTKAALFTGGSVVRRIGLSNGDAKTLKAWLGSDRPGRVALAGSGKEDDGTMALLQALAPVTRLTGQSSSPVPSTYGTPHTLGIDRLANAVAAAHLFLGRPALAIDLGTCITYDLVNESATYVGGAISPGVRMRASAMHAYTAKLPLVEVTGTPLLLGTDTGSSLKSGVYHGVLAELQGYGQACRQQWPTLAVVLTGGDAPLFLAALGSRIFADPLLTLRGLHALLEHQHTSGVGAAGSGR